MKTFIAIKLYIVCIAIGFYIRFTNPDMTETRLFIEYWNIWLICAIVAVLAGYLIQEDK